MTQAHVTSLLLVGMSGKQSEMEGRLDDMLSRIAVETQEIEELERQLTDGQILANESLQRDLEGIISGLQEYLRGLREQARLAQHQVVSLQAENQSLQLHLEHSARTHRQDLSVQQEEADALRERQVQLEAELTRTQDEKASLQLTVWRLQAQCEVSRTVMDRTRIQLDQITEALLEPQELHIGPEHTYRTEDMLSRSVEQLLRAIQLTRTRTNQDQSREHIHKLHYQITQDQDQITQDQDQIILNQYRRTKDQDQIPQLEVLGVDQPQDHDQDQDQDKHQNWRLQEELQRLRVRLQESESRNRVLQNNREQLQDVQQERDALLLQSVGHQRSLERLNRKLRQLSRDMRDQLTVDQLRTTSQQLRDLTHTLQEEVEEHTHIVEQLGAELHKAQRHKHRTRTRARTRTRTEGGAVVLHSSRTHRLRTGPAGPPS
ncbi:centriolin isoform X1 [Eleginops maclovinus]|uniref:centriolin isoform X1 n=2 Tax=Eleginops maclovinus TaxID=56733 RepID=UPI0030803348